MQNNNLALKSPILDSTGVATPSTSSWRAPGGQSPYFGWLGDEGFTTLRIDSIKAMTPHPQMRGRSVVWLEGALNVVVNSEDSARLLKRLGWCEPGAKQ